MRLARFVYRKKVYWGKLQTDGIILLRSEPFSKIALSSRKIAHSAVKLLAPCSPSKIILIGLNYRDHARELRMKIPHEPIIFLKPNTAVIGPGESIIYPRGVKRLDYEAELAVVIKKKAKAVPRSQALKCVLGFTCLNDVTARDLQKRDGQWTRAKSFDSFCPIGPWLETNLELKTTAVRLYLNGKLRQNSSTANFIFPLDYIISFVSRVMKLLPGDVISTGTPLGVGAMKRGDLVEVDIEGLGRLENRVI